MPKGRELEQFADSRGGVFLRGVDNPMHTMSKVGGWGVLRNGEDLSNGGGELIPLYGLYEVFRPKGTPN